MFGWGRKTDGFEWHKYVRTTIRLKREDRRIRVEGVKLAALEGLKDAGRAGASAGVSGLAALWSGFWGAIVWAFNKVTAGGKAMARTMAKAAAPAGRSLLEKIGPIGKRLADTGLVALLIASGVAALHAALIRSRGTGLHDDAILPALVAILALAAGFAPLITGHLGLKLPRGLDAPIRRLLARVPAVARLSPGQSQVIAIGALALLIAVFGLLSMRGGTGLTQLASFTPFAAKPIEGKASVVAGDIIRIGSTNIRLSGIEAPEADQKCSSGGKKRWACGEAAQASLTKLVRGKTLRCELSGADDEGRQFGVCKTVNAGSAQDIAALLVKEGAVFSKGGLWGSYDSLESEAKARKTGLWRGDAERPAEYRAKLWEQARKAAPEGCPIKGQVAGERRTYVLPWAADYGSVRIKTSRGERWFCSENEAKAAGWTVASR